MRVKVVKIIFLLLVTILIPPLAVFLKRGFGKDLLINIILTILLFVPGVIHAIWVVIEDL